MQRIELKDMQRFYVEKKKKIKVNPRMFRNDPEKAIFFIANMQ